MITSKSSRMVETLTVGGFAGIAGGVAEIGWIGLYGAATGVSLNPIARGIVESVSPVLAVSPWSAELGVLVHLGLAVALGMCLAFVLAFVVRSRGGRSEASLIVLTLAAVWAVNFLVILPRTNETFVHLLPYGVTLFSKLLFGLAASATFRAHHLRRARVSIRGRRAITGE